MGQQPDRVVKPGTPEGDAAGLDPKKNGRLYEFDKPDGSTAQIRRDKPAQYGDGGKGDQGDHFNSGTKDPERAPDDQKLQNHHNINP